MSETKKTNRQLMGERYKSKNPEFNADDDEAVFGEALSELGKADEYEAARNRFNETISNNEIAPDLLNGIVSGKNADGSDFDLTQYLFDNHMDYLIDYMEDNEGAKKKYEERKEERRKAAEQEGIDRKAAEQKIQEEDKELDAAIREAGYKPDQVKDLIDWIYDLENGFITRAKNFDLKKDDFIRLFHIKDYDLKMKEADETGYKRGKNEKIDMYKRKAKERKDMPADAGSGGGTPQSGGPQEDPYLKRLEHMKNF